MTESLGTASINIVVDTSNMEAAIQRAQNLTAGMSQQAQAEYAKLNAAEKRRVDSLLRQAETLGMTRQEQILFNAALKGVPTGVLDDLKRRLAGVGAQTQANTLSAKQMQQAIRGVPAQITDIFVSLQGGTNPLTVLLQQGGQLRDMFGGIGPAARALGSSLLGLINPITVTAAAVGVLAAAWSNAEREQSGFHRAIIQTGNFAGVTADELAALSVELEAATAATRGMTSEAVAQATATGKFTGEQLRFVAETAVRMQVTAGQAIDETVKTFAMLAEDPVRAIAKLNEEQHAFTAATYEQVRALQEQGREQEAATIAIRAYADELNRRTQEIDQNLGLLERGWRNLQAGAKAAWDAMLDIGRESSLDEKIGDVQAKLAAARAELARLQEGGAAPESVNYVRKQVQVLLAQRQALMRQRTEQLKEEGEADQKAALQRANNYAITLDQEAASYASAEAKRAQRIQAVRAQANEHIRAAMAAGNKELAQQIAQDRDAVIRGIEAEGRRQQRKARAPADPGGSLVQRLERQIALNRAELSSVKELTASERMRVEVIQELERIGSKMPASTKARVEALLEELRVTGQQVQADKDRKKAMEELARLQNQLGATRRNHQRALNTDLIALGRGGNIAEQLRRQLEIHQWYEEELARLRDKGLAEDSESYKLQAEEFRKTRDEMLVAEEEFQRKKSAIQADWSAGAQRAIDDFVAREQDTASRMYDIWSGAFVGLEDVLTDFFTKGKADWKGFFDSLAEEITRFIIRQQLTKWLSQVQFGMTGEGHAGGGWFNSLLQGFGSMMSGGWGGIAMGGAFGGGQRLDKFALGGVVSNPQFFMHGGRIGVMGEAGPEAIVPLHRGPDGKLGVRMAQPIAAPAPVTLNQTVVVQGRMTSHTTSQLARQSAREAAREIGRTGR